MTMSFSSDVMSATISQPQTGARPPPPPERGMAGELPDAVTAIQQLGGTLTADVKDSIIAGAQDLEQSGSSFEDIKSFVDTELEANGVDLSAAHQRSGQLVDMMS